MYQQLIDKPIQERLFLLLLILYFLTSIWGPSI
ncbi:unnamed protein product [Spirodela intermedia]|uniref:Uncharacterized protein n=1 Tax=Spirodela intermedia TaxID=51605 RepID=A0A7I8KJI7_SPIIN|nr:unnamed protein product [Spirodela intermedia]